MCFYSSVSVIFNLFPQLSLSVYCVVQFITRLLINSIVENGNCKQSNCHIKKIPLCRIWRKVRLRYCNGIRPDANQSRSEERNLAFEQTKHVIIIMPSLFHEKLIKKNQKIRETTGLCAMIAVIVCFGGIFYRKF